MKYTTIQIIEAVADHKSLAATGEALNITDSYIRKILANELAVSQYHIEGRPWRLACRRYVENFCGPQDINYDPALEFDLEDEFFRL